MDEFLSVRSRFLPVHSLDSLLRLATCHSPFLNPQSSIRNPQSAILNPQSAIRNRKSAIELLGGVPEDGRDSPVMGGIGENLFDVAACFTERNTLYKLRQVDVSKIFQPAFHPVLARIISCKHQFDPARVPLQELCHVMDPQGNVSLRLIEFSGRVRPYSRLPGNSPSRSRQHLHQAPGICAGPRILLEGRFLTDQSQNHDGIYSVLSSSRDDVLPMAN